MIQIVNFELSSDWVQRLDGNGLQIEQLLRRAEPTRQHHIFERQWQNIVRTDPAVRYDLYVVERVHNLEQRYYELRGEAFLLFGQREVVGIQYGLFVAVQH